jgi:predicted dehydrogenase
MDRKLRMGMVGGGKGAFIGAVHRIAAAMDGEIELVAGAFSSNPQKSMESGASLYLAKERTYPSFTEMIEKEKALPEDVRIDIVSIVTPNHLHFAPTKLALENGFDVILDKPMTFSLEEAKELQKIVEKTGATFCLTHTYTGYPMIKEARRLIADGKIGAVRKIYVAYPQGWLSEKVEGGDNKQAEWRTDPSKSGIAGCMGDIGTHAFNLAEYVTGLSVNKICAELNTFVEGRKLDDDGMVLMKFEGGGTGLLYATQIAAGDENNVNIAVFGEKGGIEWKQDDANSLLLKWPDRPTEIYRTGNKYLSSYAAHNTRTPAGHPEGYLEAFANLYRNFALTVRARRSGRKPEPEWLDFPGIEDGVRGMAFIENVVESNKRTEKWMDFTI